ncbi:hypothetical protein TWF481_006093 [Arthrobotrys musiformis]|uniref:G domain-containing protein n=1 Tax=Arthrobotrys musiformis TaxID=47236 RepID=A0AAV9WHQ5_9PEZI
MNREAPLARSNDESDPEDEVFIECRRFRILVIGKSGVGKSSLLTCIFGLSEERVNVKHALDGEAGQHNIEQEFTSKRNNLLVMHDSGGFEPADPSNVNRVKEFIDGRGKQESLEKQLHCIWYCISCTDARPVGRVEKDFFAFLRNRPVRVVFVFTKFDELVNNNTGRKFRECASQGNIDYSKLAEQATQEAYDTVNKLRQLVQGNVQTGHGIVAGAVSIHSPEMIDDLVIQTTRVVVKPQLRNLWLSAQRVSAVKKCEITIDIAKGLFKKARKRSMVPFYRIRFSDIFTNLYDKTLNAWNLRDDDQILQKETMQTKFRQAIHDEKHPTEKMVLTTLADFTGPLTASHYLRWYIVWAADLILIFEKLFWNLKSGETKVLAYEMVENVLAEFRHSDTRKNVYSLVKGEIGSDIAKASKSSTVDNLLKRIIVLFSLSAQRGVFPPADTPSEITETSTGTQPEIKAEDQERRPSRQCARVPETTERVFHTELA